MRSGGTRVGSQAGTVDDVDGAGVALRAIATDCPHDRVVNAVPVNIAGRYSPTSTIGGRFAGHRDRRAVRPQCARHRPEEHVCSTAVFRPGRAHQQICPAVRVEVSSRQRTTQIVPERGQCAVSTVQRSQTGRHGRENVHLPAVLARTQIGVFSADGEVFRAVVVQVGEHEAQTTANIPIACDPSVCSTGRHNTGQRPVEYVGVFLVGIALSGARDQVVHPITVEVAEGKPLSDAILLGVALHDRGRRVQVRHARGEA